MTQEILNAAIGELQTDCINTRNKIENITKKMREMIRSTTAMEAHLSSEMEMDALNVKLKMSREALSSLLSLAGIPFNVFKPETFNY